MSDVWKLDEGPSILRELVHRAEADGPQRIESDGEPIAVVLSMATYQALAGGRTDAERPGEAVEDYFSSAENL